MRFNLDDLEVSLPEFGQRVSISRVEIIQIEAWIKRQKQYLKALELLFYCLDSVSADHYKICPFNILMNIKGVLQSFLWAREALYSIIEYLHRDVQFLETQLEEIKARRKENESQKRTRKKNT